MHPSGHVTRSTAGGRWEWLQLSPHPLVKGAMSIFRYSARSDCDYYEHHRCGNKHKLNRGQYQHIAHVNLPCNGRIQPTPSIGRCSSKRAGKMPQRRRSLSATVRRAHAQSWGLRGVRRSVGTGRQ